MTFEHNWMQNWRVVAERLQKKYPALSEEDLAYEKGQEEQLLNRLQGKLGLRSHELEELMMQEARPNDTYDVTDNAFRGIPENDPDNNGMTGRYHSDQSEFDRMPRTHAPRSEGYDNGKVDSGSDTDPRR